MSTPSFITKGKLVLQNLPDLFCFTDAKDFLTQLPNLLGVEVPADITNVIVSNTQPLDSQTTDVWFRISNSGSFMGIYVFSQGQWRAVFPYPNGVYWMYGDSRTVPEGYALIDSSNAAVAPAVTASLMTQYVPDPGNTYFLYFAVTYVGF